MEKFPVSSRSSTRPQVFGLLPSRKFWADSARQQLAVPLVTMIAVPLTVLWFLIVVWLRLPPWTLLLDALVTPVSFGVVERLLRARFRSALEARPNARMVTADPDCTRLAALVIGICVISVLLIGLVPPILLVCAALGATGGAVVLLDRAVRRPPRGALTEGRR
jgi:hypothetical protein